MTLRRRILLIIGGTLDAIIHRGILEERIAFLEKPFSPAVLAQRVREVLDGDGPKPAANGVN